MVDARFAEVDGSRVHKLFSIPRPWKNHEILAETVQFHSFECLWSAQWHFSAPARGRNANQEVSINITHQPLRGVLGVERDLIVR